MSSSSSPDPGQGPAGGYVDTIRHLLERALQTLAVELPSGFTRLCSVGRGSSIELGIDDERFLVVFDDTGGVDLTDADADADPATVHLTTSRATVAAVLGGGLSLTDAVDTDRLSIQGPVDRVVQLHDTLVAFMQGAVRCPSMAAIGAHLNERSPIDRI